jgi:hypothetical protein
MEKFYWVGFEDGFADCSCRESGLTSKEAFLYRKGFKDGYKARDEAPSECLPAQWIVDQRRG